VYLTITRRKTYSCKEQPLGFSPLTVTGFPILCLDGRRFRHLKSFLVGCLKEDDWPGDARVSLSALLWINVTTCGAREVPVLGLVHERVLAPRIHPFWKGS
jgi:hypothetical protein